MDTGFDFGSLLLNISAIVPGTFRGALAFPAADSGPAAAEIVRPPEGAALVFLAHHRLSERPERGG
jgi:hypothetical protein